MTVFGVALLSAIATALLAVLAILTARFAVKAFRKQSEEVAILRGQADRDKEERRRTQAAQVFIMTEPGDKQQDHVLLKATAHNASNVPVYDLRVQWRSAKGEFGTLRGATAAATMRSIVRDPLDRGGRPGADSRLPRFP